jgi:hypothetical protein
MDNDRMDIVPNQNVFERIASRVREVEKAKAGAAAMDKNGPWQANADPGRPTTPPTGTYDDNEAIKLLDIEDMKWEISFTTTPDDVLFDFLRAAGNPTINERKIMLHALKTLRFDNHMVGQWAMDRWKRMDTSNQVERQLPNFRAREVDEPIVEFFIHLDHVCATNNVKEKTIIDTLMNAITKDEEAAMVQMGVNCNSTYEAIKRNMITRYDCGWAAWIKKTFEFPLGIQTAESWGIVSATCFNRWMTSWNGSKKLEDLFLISHLINSVEKEVSETLLEKWNVNKNVTREEFFQMADRELARLEKPLHVALKHVVGSNSKLLQTKPDKQLKEIRGL